MALKRPKFIIGAAGIFIAGGLCLFWGKRALEKTILERLVAFSEERGVIVSSLRLSIKLPAVLDLLSGAGIRAPNDITASRKLTFDTEDIARAHQIRLMVLRGVDVPTYVEHGIADIGVSGKEVLMEHGEHGYYEPLDLRLGFCNLMTAGIIDEQDLPARFKVATKFVNISKRFYAAKGCQVDIIKLYGGMELAPITGLAHRIVDIVETGSTLKANGLTAMELIAPISTRLIVNKASMKMKHAAVKDLLSRLEQQITVEPRDE